MFDAGYFMELSPQKVVGSKLLYPFLLNVYMHDFDQFVENLSDEYRNIAILCNKNNYKDLNIQKCRSRRSGKFSIQMSKIYDELAKHSTKDDKFLSNCVVSKGRPFENVWGIQLCKIDNEGSVEDYNTYLSKFGRRKGPKQVLKEGSQRRTLLFYCQPQNH